MQWDRLVPKLFGEEVVHPVHAHRVHCFELPTKLGGLAHAFFGVCWAGLPAAGKSTDAEAVHGTDQEVRLDFAIHDANGNHLSVDEDGFQRKADFGNTLRLVEWLGRKGIPPLLVVVDPSGVGVWFPFVGVQVHGVADFMRQRNGQVELGTAPYGVPIVVLHTRKLEDFARALKSIYEFFLNDDYYGEGCAGTLSAHDECKPCSWRVGSYVLFLVPMAPLSRIVGALKVFLGHGEFAAFTGADLKAYMVLELCNNGPCIENMWGGGRQLFISEPAGLPSWNFFLAGSV